MQFRREKKTSKVKRKHAVTVAVACPLAGKKTNKSVAMDDRATRSRASEARTRFVEVAQLRYLSNKTAVDPAHAG